MAKDLLGRRLANFQIERVIGRGGMAEVYYGLDVKLQRPVAIKVIDARHRDNPDYAKRFVREAQAVATWRHEHIVQIYYADDEDDLYYFVMEYIDGQDLGQLMRQYQEKNQKMPYDEVLQIGNAFASALDYTHQKGVIHRDVKPSNLMIAKDGRAVLTDFGLAMDIQQGSLGEVFGSANYIAPEQARRSADAVPQSDLYALGVILYEMLTGEVPFDDASPTAVGLQHMTMDVPLPQKLNPDLSEEVEAVLLKALKKSPENRYQSGQALMNALAQALTGVKPPVADQPTIPMPAADATLNSSAEDLVGQQLDEYRLESLEGQGGMARIYQGVDVGVNRRVAIKVIDTSFRSNSKYIQRFQREAQAIAQLEHPHIVRLYRYGEAKGVLYIAMQYIEGKNLHAVLANYQQQGEFMPVGEISRIIHEVCGALDYAHNQGVIHRDVKPSNIMLNDEGDVFLADFGLALLTEIGTRGEILGSPHYLAPEQAMSSANVVAQSDLYAVGIILYEMLTGEIPFSADEPLDIAMLHMAESPPLPTEVRPGISPEIEAVLLKAIAKKPEDRYPTGAALANALDEALQTSPIKDVPLAAMVTSSTRILDDAELPPVPAAVESQPGEPRPEPPSIISVMSDDKFNADDKSVGRSGSKINRVLVIGAGVLLCVILAIFASTFLWLRGDDGQVEHEQRADLQPAGEIIAESTLTKDVEEVLPTKTNTPVATSVTGASAGDNLDFSQPTEEQASPTPEPTATLVETTPTAALTTTSTLTEDTPIYRLAFTRWDGNAHTIWSADIDGENQEALFKFAGSPSWSPDGNYIAFIGEKDIERLGYGEPGVWRMTAGGWNPTPLKEDGAAHSVAWMPTGNSIAYEANHGGADIRVYFIDFYGVDQPGAIPGEHPAWSPDGTRLVMRVCRPDCGLWIVGRSDTNLRQLTWGANDGLPVWSPDGKKIAFSRDTGATDVFVINADGTGDPQQLTDASGHDSLPVWTPDGEQIIFRSTRNGRWQIFIMNADGSGQRLIIDQAPVSDQWVLDRMSVTD